MNSTERRSVIEELLGEELKFSTEEVAERGGLTLEKTTQIWRNLGFPEPEAGALFGQSDVEALAIVSATIEQKIMDERTVMRLTRALGQTMSRLADWEVSILVDSLESEDVEEWDGSSIDAAVAVAAATGPGFDQLLLHVWRRHLAAAAMRLEAREDADEQLLATEMSVGFADLTRFTSLSNRIDQAELADVVEEFETLCGDIVTAGGARIIKTMGDAMLFVHPDPFAATRISLDVIAGVAARDSLPDVRVGLATGSVVSRLGDVFGPPVNLAARLSHVARANRLLVDDATAAAIGAEYDTRILPPRPIRGFGNVSPITVTERRAFRVR